MKTTKELIISGKAASIAMSKEKLIALCHELGGRLEDVSMKLERSEPIVSAIEGFVREEAFFAMKERGI